MADDRVDWFRVIADLQRAGMPHAQIAKEVDVSRPTIINWQSGITEPKFSKGTKLLGVYRSVVGST